MTDIRPIGFFSTGSGIGRPTVELGNIDIHVSSLTAQSQVGTPQAGHISMVGRPITSSSSGVGYPSVYEISDGNEVHPLIEHQVPQFVQEDHREFLAFMQAYFRYTEKKGGPLHELRRLLSLQDIDTTTQELLKFFFIEYAPSFPRKLAISPALILKNIRQFYLARGSEKSFEFLFRVFFNQEIELYYPRLDILRVSDGKWIQNISVKCILKTGDPKTLVGNRIVGRTTGTTAFVENVLVVQDGPTTVHELFLNRSSIVGKFSDQETITAENSDCQLQVLKTITKVKIENAGSGYVVGDEVVFNGVGNNARAAVRGIDDETGAITAVDIYQFGSNYVPDSTTITVESMTGRGAYLTPVFDTIIKYSGYFLNSDGMPSALKYIQDNYYYQQYSYVIKSEESRNWYENIVDRLIHPAGLIYFSQVVTSSFLDVSLESPDQPDGAADVTIFTDYQHDEYEIFPSTDLSYLPGFTQDEEIRVPVFVHVNAEVSIEDADIVLFAEDVDFGVSADRVGPTWEDFEAWKADYRPTPVFGLPDDEILEPGYYAMYANTPLKAFADVRLADIVFRPTLGIDHLPEAAITQEEESL